MNIHRAALPLVVAALLAGCGIFDSDPASGSIGDGGAFSCVNQSGAGHGFELRDGSLQLWRARSIEPTGVAPGGIASDRFGPDSTETVARAELWIEGVVAPDATIVWTLGSLGEPDYAFDVDAGKLRWVGDEVTLGGRSWRIGHAAGTKRIRIGG